MSVKALFRAADGRRDEGRLLLRASRQDTSARDPDGNEWEVFVVLENTEPAANACACGDKVSHAGLAEASPISTFACCTPSQKATTIATTNSPCC